MNTATAFSAGLAAAIALAAMAQAATPTASEHSANNILPGCRFLVSPKPATITSDVSGWSVGLCSIEFLPCLFLRPGGGDGSSRSIAMVDLSRFLFLGVLGALLLTACTAAISPSPYRVTELVPGISTRDDAIAKLGPPSSTSNIGNSTILQWGGNNSPVHLAISFGMDGRMIQAATDAQKLDQLSGATQ